MTRSAVAGLLYLLQICVYAVGSKSLFGVKLKWKWSVLVGGESICLLLAGNVKNDKQYNVALLLVYLLGIISGFIMLEGKKKTRMIILLTLLSISLCMDDVFGIFVDHIPYIGERHGFHIVLEAIMTAGILFIFGCVKRYLNIRQIKNIVRKYIIFAIIWIIICQGCIVGGLLFARVYLPTEKLKAVYELISVMSFIGIVCIVAFIVYVQMANVKMEQLLVTERELKKMQQQYYAVLLERESDTRKYRHDMNNHLLCLHELSKEEKVEDIKLYIEEMKKDFSVIQKKCYATGNDIMDILLNFHLSDLQDTDISVMGQCTKKPVLSEVEFCTVFSNMIQNAVEEVKRQQEKKKYIKVKIKQGNQYLSITVKNSSKLLWDKKEKDLTTVKKDKKNHGIGIGNIIETAEKNGGSFELTGDGTEVTAILLLPYS